mmetsp:Transcript_7201/g.11333  ORF Transcript_7201/g.11333 Transcript_7201/m.11333 type:complete len:445 (-) Transcript_7201:88-1422(-)
MWNKQQQQCYEEHSSPFAQWRQYASMARPIHTPQRRVRAIEKNQILDYRAREAEKFRVLKNAFDSMRLQGDQRIFQSTNDVTMTTMISRKKTVRLDPLRISSSTTNNVLTKGKEAKTWLASQTTGRAAREQHQPQASPLNFDDTTKKKKEQSQTKSSSGSSSSSSEAAAASSMPKQQSYGEFARLEAEKPESSVLSPARLRDKISSLLPEFQELCQNLSIFAAVKDSMQEHKEEWCRILKQKKQKNKIEKMKMTVRKEETPQKERQQADSATMATTSSKELEGMTGVNTTTITTTTTTTTTTHQDHLEGTTTKADISTLDDDKERDIRSEYQDLFTMMEKTGAKLHSFDEGLWRLYAVFDKYVEMFFLWEDATTTTTTTTAAGDSKDDWSDHDLVVSQKYTLNLKNYAVQILRGVVQMNATYSLHDGEDDGFKSKTLKRIKEEE